MKATKALLAAATLFLATGAFAESSDNQPSIPHAYYGRDGFWHCERGYVAGESGACEPIKETWRYSTFTRLEKAESESSAPARTTRN
jgi:hypothetical protein